MSVSSDEINLLVQHYLQELGYSHAAFAFGCESKIPLNPIAQRPVQPGSLVYLIQKGIMYSQMEAAAEAALSEPANLFAHQLNLLRANLRQSTDLVDELCAATRKMKVFPSPDQTDIKPIYLNSTSAIILEAHPLAALVSAWAPNSDLFATGSADGSVVVWRFEYLENGTCILHHNATILKPQEDPKQPDITSLSWNNDPNDPILAVGTFSGIIVLYRDGVEICRISHHTSPIIDVSFSPNGSIILSGAVDGSVAISKNDAVIANWKLTSGELSDAIWLDDNKAVATCGQTVYILAEGQEPNAIYTAHAEIVQAAVDLEQQIFAVGDSSGSVQAFDNTYNPIHTNQTHRNGVCTIQWAKSPNTYVSGGCDGKVKLVNIKSNQPVVFDTLKSPVYSVVIDSNSRYVACASGDMINIYTVENSKIAIMYETTFPVIALSWSPNGRFLSVNLQSGQVAVIDFEQLC